MVSFEHKSDVIVSKIKAGFREDLLIWSMPAKTERSRVSWSAIEKKIKAYPKLDILSDVQNVGFTRIAVDVSSSVVPIYHNGIWHPYEEN